jgi:hypothetical protein
VDEVTKVFKNQDLFVLRDCLGILVKNLYVCDDEELPIRDKLKFKNIIEIDFALNELSRVLGDIDLDKLYPNWKEKEDAISQSGNLGVYSYFRKRKYIMNAREVMAFKSEKEE